MLSTNHLRASSLRVPCSHVRISQSRSFFLPFIRRRLRNNEKLLYILEIVDERRGHQHIEFLKWMQNSKGGEKGQVKMKSDSTEKLEYDIDLITLRKVPKGEGMRVVQARTAETAAQNGAEKTVAGKIQSEIELELEPEPKENVSKKEKEREAKEREKALKEEKEKAAKEKEKEKADMAEKELKAPSKDNPKPKFSTSGMLSKIIQTLTEELKKMAPPKSSEKPAARKEVVTPAQKTVKSQATDTTTAKVADLTKLDEKVMPPSPASIKTEKATASTVTATDVPKSEKAVKSPQVEEKTKSNTGKEAKDSAALLDADVDDLLPLDVRSATGIAPKSVPTQAKAPKAAPPPREILEELRAWMRKIAASLDLGPIEKPIPPKEHHDHVYDYEWLGTENVSAEDVLNSSSTETPSQFTKNPVPASTSKPTISPPATKPAPLIEPVVPTLPFTEPPTLPTTSPPPQKNYYILVRNSDTGSMHFSPLPPSLITSSPTLSRTITAFDAMRQLGKPEAFLPLWKVLQKGGFEVVGADRECLVVSVERDGSLVKRGLVLKEIREMMAAAGTAAGIGAEKLEKEKVSPAERVAREVWGKRPRKEEKMEEEVWEVLGKRKRPGRKVFWGAVWVAACTGAVTVGLENYM